MCCASRAATDCRGHRQGQGRLGAVHHSDTLTFISEEAIPASSSSSKIRFGASSVSSSAAMPWHLGSTGKSGETASLSFESRRLGTRRTLFSQCSASMRQWRKYRFSAPQTGLFPKSGMDSLLSQDLLQRLYDFVEASALSPPCVGHASSHGPVLGAIAPCGCWPGAVPVPKREAS